MNFPGSFRDHILPEKTHMLTVSFLVDSMKRLRGGVAGNVALTLALLGERPLVLASAGQDFGEYRAWMEEHGIDHSGIAAVADEFTASCFINTDLAGNQIVAFYTGAMAYSKNLSLVPLGLGPDDLVLISPTDPEAMSRYARECRELGVPFLFDPGKQTPRLTGEQIVDGLQGAKILVGNDYEFAMMAQATGKTEEELIRSVPITLVTRGGEGATIYTEGREIHIPIAPVERVLDPTGAGDAFLGGFVFGLSRGLPLETAGRIAALAASYCIEQHGCQEHSYTSASFAERYAATFGTPLPLEALAAQASA
ncbi:carbohydrate kinase family protein [Chloroflexia bacterium SDU3-3]|nr:carbohydrate kinase family protein [Chloroflexia bacterium SDU3-3]